MNIKPHPKVSAATAGCALAGVVVWSINTFVRIHWHIAATDPAFVPSDISDAFKVVCTFGFGWVCPSE